MKNYLIFFVVVFGTIINVTFSSSNKTLMNLINEKFFPFPASEIIKAENANYTGGHRLENNLELAQFHLVVGYEGISILSEEYYKLEMLANIWGGSISSRLFQEIREKIKRMKNEIWKYYKTSNWNSCKYGKDQELNIIKNVNLKMVKEPF